MYTFCPACSTVFSLKAEHLLAAAGRVRCGECGHVFRAFDYVYEELETVHSALADHLDLRAHQGDEQPHLGDIDAGEATGQEKLCDIPVDSIAADYSVPPEFSRFRPERSDLWRNLGKGAVIGVLLLLLGVQWLYFNRNVLAAQNRLRPGLQTLCAVLRCELPLRIDLSRIELVNRDVRKHPRVENALLINATLVNRADYRQPYPTLEVTFSNSTGTLVAARRFKPTEYLDKRADIEAGMPVNAPLQVMLEIRDPGEDAVSFQFEFL